mmetsp:Transcript_58557/g.174360  ORF Transcript_58557/g.174360 Transcript_58557/m.174360 type:complete len:269 (+) Transcript_58557:2390-3196(+)
MESSVSIALPGAGCVRHESGRACQGTVGLRNKAGALITRSFLEGQERGFLLPERFDRGAEVANCLLELLLAAALHLNRFLQIPQCRIPCLQISQQLPALLGLDLLHLCCHVGRLLHLSRSCPQCRIVVLQAHDPVRKILNHPLVCRVLVYHLFQVLHLLLQSVLGGPQVLHLLRLGRGSLGVTLGGPQLTGHFHLFLCGLFPQAEESLTEAGVLRGECSGDVVGVGTISPYSSSGSSRGRRAPTSPAIAGLGCTFPLHLQFCLCLVQL